MSQQPSTRTAIVLLSGQAFALGLSLAWLSIPANAIFLERFGSGVLPVTYIGAALAGGASSVLLGRALRRQALGRVVLRVLAIVTVVLVAVWLTIGFGGAEWLSFVVLVLLPITIPVGFMFVVGQAGMLLDVRVMKALYPRVIAGFAIGFALGGLVAPASLAGLGGTEHLFVAAAVASTFLLALVATTLRLFPDELLTFEAEDEAEPVAVGALRSNRLVMLVLAYQMLSAVESQMLDFLVYDRAASRYPDTDGLARFVGRFFAVTYGLDIFFLLVVAGLLLGRFGLRLGLATNPAVVLSFVVATIVASVASGSGATLVFVLAVATRVSDLVLSDGTSRTSISAAYQAVPPRERLAAQTLVESLAVPVAIGASGVILLILRATVGTEGLGLLFVVLPVLVAWVACSIAIFSEYRVHLLENLRHRVLVPGALDSVLVATPSVVDRLIESDDPRDVRLGLEALVASGHPERADRLAALAAAARPDVFRHVMDHLMIVDDALAIAAARSALGHHHPDVRLVSIDILGRDGGSAHAHLFAGMVDDRHSGVRVAAVGMLGRAGHRGQAERVHEIVAELVRSEDLDDRIVAGGVLAELTKRAPTSSTQIERLLGDAEPAVVSAALSAVRWPEDSRLGALMVELLGRREVAAAAIDALARGGDEALPLLDEHLALGHAGDPRTQALLRAHLPYDRHGGAVDVLRRHVMHADRDVGLAALSSIAAVGIAFETERAEDESWLSSLIALEVGHAASILDARLTLASITGAAPLVRALGDELELTRQRLVAALAVRYGEEALSRVSVQLERHDPRARALALEWLDATLVGGDRAALALMDDGSTDAEQLRLVRRSQPGPSRSVAALLADLIHDPDDVWRRPWLSACAVVAAAANPGLAGEDFLHGMDDEHFDPLVAETRAGVVGRGGTVVVLPADPAVHP